MLPNSNAKIRYSIELVCRQVVWLKTVSSLSIYIYRLLDSIESKLTNDKLLFVLSVAMIMILDDLFVSMRSLLNILFGRLSGNHNIGDQKKEKLTPSDVECALEWQARMSERNQMQGHHHEEEYDEEEESDDDGDEGSYEESNDENAFELNEAGDDSHSPVLYDKEEPSDQDGDDEESGKSDATESEYGNEELAEREPILCNYSDLEFVPR